MYIPVLKHNANIPAGVEGEVQVVLLKYLLCHSILLPVITFKHHEPTGNIRAQLEYLMKVS